MNIITSAALHADIGKAASIYTVRLDSLIWTATGVIVLVAISTKTDIIKNLLGKIRQGPSQSQGYANHGYGHAYGYSYGYGYEPSSWSYGCGYYQALTEEQYPSQTFSQYNPEFDYQNTESQPRAAADQQAEDEERRLVQEPYPSHVIHQYVPPPPQPIPPNQHLCTGECKPGTCDSQGFCIDSGCGSVIRGGSQCKHKHKNNIHPTTPEENRQYQYPEYYPSQPPEPTSTPGGIITYLNTPWDGGTGCRETAGRMSCRRQGDVPAPFKTEGNYGLSANVLLGNFSGISEGHGSPGVSTCPCLYVESSSFF